MPIKNYVFAISGMGQNGDRPHGELVSIVGYGIDDPCGAIRFTGLYGTDHDFGCCGLSDGEVTLVEKPSRAAPVILPKGSVVSGSAIKNAQAIVYQDGRMFVRDAFLKTVGDGVLAVLESNGASLYREMTARMSRL